MEISCSQFISGKMYVVHDIRNWRFIKYFKKHLNFGVNSSWILVTNVPLVFHEFFLVYLFSCILISNSQYAVMIFPLEELQANNLDSLKWRMDLACKTNGGELERYIQRQCYIWLKRFIKFGKGGNFKIYKRTVWHNDIFL